MNTHALKKSSQLVGHGCWPLTQKHLVSEVKRMLVKKRNRLRLKTHDAVKAVEGGVKVRAGPQSIHLNAHLRHEDTQEYELGKVYKGGTQGTGGVRTAENGFITNLMEAIFGHNNMKMRQ